MDPAQVGTRGLERGAQGHERRLLLGKARLHLPEQLAQPGQLALIVGIRRLHPVDALFVSHHAHVSINTLGL